MMYLRAGFAEKVNGKYSIFVKFGYNPTYVELVKSMKHRIFNSTTKEWEVSWEDYTPLISTLNQYGIPYNGKEFEYSINQLNQQVEKLQAIQKQEANVDDSILDNVEFKTTPFPYQKQGIAYGLTHDNFLIADEQGCIDGDAIIQVRINNTTHHWPLSKVYKKFHDKNWNSFRVRYLNMEHNTFQQGEVLDVVDSGEKDCYKLKLENGKEIIATGDHEILTTTGYKPLIELTNKDYVITNGELKCKMCGSTENIIKDSKSKYVGYCKKCMYKYLRKNGNAYTQTVRKIRGNYWHIYGPQFRNHHLNTRNGILEHQLIAEQKYGRKIDFSTEVVHHLDGNSLNNDPQNLVIITKQEHAKIHSEEKWKSLYKKDYQRGGETVVIVPKQSRVKSIEHVGIKHVYDIKMNNPHHNFVANRIVVHNCGKTLQTVNIARLKRGGNHCLIIAGYDSLQFNWVKEIHTHTDEGAYVIGQRAKKNGRIYLGNLKDRLEDIQNLDKIKEFFIITAPTTLRQCEKQKYLDKNGKEKTNKEFYMATLLEHWCQVGEIGRIIVDEFQVMKNVDSSQSQALLKLKSCPYKIAATGTPLMNKNIDLFTLMTWLGYEDKNFYEFRNRYCIMGGYKNKEIKGNKNNVELNQRLSQFMIRRKKEDVLDLPEKIYIDELLDLDGKQWGLYEKHKKLAKAQLSHMKGNKVALLASALNLRKITCHPQWVEEQITESVKFERTVQLVYEAVQNNKKTIIFSNFSTPIDWLYDILKPYNPAKITGDTKDRMEQVDKFQNDENCFVILGTIGAMGTGLTLNRASNVIFIDEPWNRALKDQAVDRAHRIGTKNNVNIYTLICRGTIDESVHRTVMEKGRLADEIVDGVTIEELEEILEGD